MERCFDSTGSCLSALHRGHRETEQCLNDVDRALSSADNRITTLEAMYKELRDASILLKTKVNNLEGHSCRLNISIAGVKDRLESSSLNDFLSCLIPELLGQDNFSKPVKIDRAHCSLRSKLLTNERLRVITARVQNNSTKANIFQIRRQMAVLN